MKGKGNLSANISKLKQSSKGENITLKDFVESKLIIDLIIENIAP
jgi:hypothetical protein